MRLILLLITIVICFIPSSYGQTSPVSIDTINIYKDEAGVSFKTYMKTWFFQYGLWNSYSYNPVNFNAQDSLVILPHPPRYFRVYDAKQRLWFEGQTTSDDGDLIGDIKYYYKSGQLKRIEHLDGQQVDCVCTNDCYGWNDGQGPEGTWKYFRKDGTQKKQVVYTIFLKSCNPTRVKYVRLIYTFKKNGDKKNVRWRNA